MDHLHVVTRAGLADPVAAGLAVDLSSSLLEDLLDSGPSRGGTAGHKRGTISSTLLTTGNTRAYEEQALGFELLRAADRVGVVRVTTIDDNITLFEVGLEELNEVINGLASLDEKDDFAGTLQLGDKLFDRVSTLDVGAYSSESEGNQKELTNVTGTSAATDLWPRSAGNGRPCWWFG